MNLRSDRHLSLFWLGQPRIGEMVDDPCPFLVKHLLGEYEVPLCILTELPDLWVICIGSFAEEHKGVLQALHQTAHLVGDVRVPCGFYHSNGRLWGDGRSPLEQGADEGEHLGIQPDAGILHLTPDLLVLFPVHEPCEIAIVGADPDGESRSHQMLLQRVCGVAVHDMDDTVALVAGVDIRHRAPSFRPHPEPAPRPWPSGRTA